MNIFSSFGHQFTKGMPYFAKSLDYWHPGYAWACTRTAYEKMGCGLYQEGILGSSDNIMAFSLIGKGLKAIQATSSYDYKESILEFQKRVRGLRLGYIPGVIRHYFHGTKKNRKYTERWQILLNHNYSPKKHLNVLSSGLIVPSTDCPSQLLTDIFNYFKERNEDEFFHDKIAKMTALEAEENVEETNMSSETNMLSVEEVPAEISVQSILAKVFTDIQTICLYETYDS
jgi:hypothetical protein